MKPLSKLLFNIYHTHTKDSCSVIFIVVVFQLRLHYSKRLNVCSDYTTVDRIIVGNTFFFIF